MPQLYILVACFKIEIFDLSPEVCSFVSIILEKYIMRAGPQLGVDAYGVSGFTRLCRSASSPSQHSFCALLRRKYLGRRFHSLNVNLFARKRTFISLNTEKVLVNYNEVGVVCVDLWKLQKMYIHKKASLRKPFRMDGTGFEPVTSAV